MLLSGLVTGKRKIKKQSVPLNRNHSKSIALASRKIFAEQRMPAHVLYALSLKHRGETGPVQGRIPPNDTIFMLRTGKHD